MAFHGGTGSGYSYCLEKIAEDFDIPVTNLLEQYITELGDNIKFAEAGLLLKESSILFSKRVDYLYRLVCQFLEQLTGTRRPSMEEARARKSKVPEMDREVTVHHKEAIEDKFVSLDDLEEHEDINLEEDYMDDTFVHPVPCVPLILIPLSVAEKDGMQLIGPNGEILGNYRDFKMNTSTIHYSCALLLDRTHSRLLDFHQPEEGVQDMDWENEDVCEEAIPNESDMQEEPPVEIRQNLTEFMPLDDLKAQKTRRVELSNSRFVHTFPQIPVLLRQKIASMRSDAEPFSESNSILDNLTMDSSGLLLITTADKPLVGWTSEIMRSEPEEEEDEDEYEFSATNVEESEDFESSLHEDLPTRDATPTDSSESDLDGSVLSKQYYVEFKKMIVRNHAIGRYKLHPTSFYTQLQTFVESTHLAQRVAEWETSMMSVLREEAKKRPYNIRQYASEILQMCESNVNQAAGIESPTLSFRDMVKDKPPFEVSRMLLAALQLANDYSIEIMTDGVLHEAMDTMTIKRL